MKKAAARKNDGVGMIALLLFFAYRDFEWNGVKNRFGIHSGDISTNMRNLCTFFEELYFDGRCDWVFTRLWFSRLGDSASKSAVLTTYRCIRRDLGSCDSYNSEPITEGGVTRPSLIVLGIIQNSLKLKMCGVLSWSGKVYAAIVLMIQKLH